MQRIQTLKLDFMTPTLGWDLKFLSVFESKDKIIAVLALTGGSPCEAVDDVSASLDIPQQSMHAKPVEYYVQTENPRHWSRKKEFTAIKDIESINKLTSQMQQIYKADEPSIRLTM